MKEGQIFTAKDKINKTEMKFSYVEKLQTIWHKIYSFESGNTFEVEDEWFNQRNIKESDNG